LLNNHRGIASEEPSSSPERPGVPSLSPEEILKQADRILADPLFKNSQRYSNLLRVIVDRTLKGHSHELKERVIGVEVFGRSPDYDTSVDPTVRVTANEIRKRLTNYYAQPDHTREIRIEIPVRSYVAEFSLPAQPAAAPSAAAVVAEELPAKSEKTRLHTWYWAAAAGALCIGLASWWAVRLLVPAPPIDRFWAPMLKGPEKVLLCISSTTANTDPSPISQLSQSADKDWQSFQQIRNATVGMTDVLASNELSTYLGTKHKKIVVQPSQGTTLEDLRAGPFVLFGAFGNDWSNRMVSQSRFSLKREGSLRWIADAQNPAGRNWSMDSSVPYQQINNVYALVTRAQDPATGQWWIGIGALTGLGTLTTEQILVDPARTARLLSALPRDWDRKNLQMVLQITIVNGSAGAEQLVSSYTW
jgi:hypothetical protein